MDLYTLRNIHWQVLIKADVVSSTDDLTNHHTDCLGITESKGNKLIKLLSVDPNNYPDAPIEGIRRLLEWFLEEEIPRGQPLDTSRIAFIRLGTTVATNALLERKGQKHALITTKGFRDVIAIGNQTRPRLFDLAIKKPDRLYVTLCLYLHCRTIEILSECVSTVKGSGSGRTRSHSMGRPHRRRTGLDKRWVQASQGHFWRYHQIDQGSR